MFVIRVCICLQFGIGLINGRNQNLSLYLSQAGRRPDWPGHSLGRHIVVATRSFSACSINGDYFDEYLNNLI
jgi:hypothetical protein